MCHDMSIEHCYNCFCYLKSFAKVISLVKYSIGPVISYYFSHPKTYNASYIKQNISYMAYHTNTIQVIFFMVYVIFLLKIHKTVGWYNG